MNNSTLWPRTNPSPLRSGAWLHHWIPQGIPSKTLEILVFLRCRHWNPYGGHCAQDADLINSTKTLLIHRNPLKTL